MVAEPCGLFRLRLQISAPALDSAGNNQISTWNLKQKVVTYRHSPTNLWLMARIPNVATARMPTPEMQRKKGLRRTYPRC